MRIQPVRKLIIPAFLAFISVVSCGNDTKRDWSRCVPDGSPKATGCKTGFVCIETYCVAVDAGPDSTVIGNKPDYDGSPVGDLAPMPSETGDVPVGDDRPMGDGQTATDDASEPPAGDGSADRPVESITDATGRDVPIDAVADVKPSCSVDKDCPSDAPLCGTDKHCRKCTNDTDCVGRGGPACDTTTGLCVACVTDDYCKAPVTRADGGTDGGGNGSSDGGADGRRDGGADAGADGGLVSMPKLYCDLQAKQCVACTKHEQCTDPAAPICSPTSKTCVACTQASTELCSARNPNKPSCRADGRCVQCTNESHGSCAGSTAICATDCGDAAAPACVAAINTCVQCTGDNHCSAVHRACDPSNNTCVECTNDSYCPIATHACDLTAKACVQCTADKYCGGNTPACNTSSQMCVECTASNHSHCAGNTPVCKTSNNTCVQCVSDNDCSGNTPMCDTSTNTCVACTTINHCSVKTPGTPLCGSSGACVECKNSGDCNSTTSPICSSSNTCIGCTADSDCSSKFGANPGVCMAHIDGHCATDEETIYVQKDNSICLSAGANAGTAAHPYCTPQTALSNLGSRNLIVLRGANLDGIAVNLAASRGLNIIGQNGAQVSGGNGASGVSLTGGDLYARGITVHYGTDPSYPGISATGGTLRLQDVVVEYNVGGGILIDGASLDATNCLVRNNGTAYDGAISWSGFLIKPSTGASATLTKVSVLDNDSTSIACTGPIHGSGIYISGNHPDMMSAQTCTSGGNITTCGSPSATCGYDAPTP